MSIAKEIISYVKNLWGTRGDHTRRHGGTPSLKGQCFTVHAVTKRFGGQTFGNREAFGELEQESPGHYVSVVPGKKAGVVVDYTSRDIVIEQVSDPKNYKLTKEQLEEITGYSGWSGKR